MYHPRIVEDFDGIIDVVYFFFAPPAASAAFFASAENGISKRP
jgi:hypothetical protein